MNKIKTIAVFAFFIFLAKLNFSQEKIVDVITLNNKNGTIKGLIIEQIPGETVKINPIEAVLKIKFEDISGGITKKTIKKDTISVDLDVINLRNGNSIEGIIMEQSPQKWIIIKTEKLATQIFSYEEIERFGKETIDQNDDIFKTNGVLDVIYLKDNGIVKGIITEQIIGESVKIKTMNGIFVYYLPDIIKTGKEAFDIKRDIFKQSAFWDVVNLKNGSSIKGIIIEQIPGQSLKILTYGNSTFVQPMSDVVKLGKEVNLYKEENKEENKTESVTTKITEPENLGDCLLIKSLDSLVAVEKQYYINETKNNSLFLIDGAERSTTRFKIGQEISLRIKVSNNSIEPKDQIFIFKVSSYKPTTNRFIDSNQHHFLSKIKDNTKSSILYPKFSATKTGLSSYDLKFTINEPGEYAVYVKGNEESFSLFGIDQNINSKK